LKAKALALTSRLCSPKELPSSWQQDEYFYSKKLSKLSNLNKAHNLLNNHRLPTTVHFQKLLHAHPSVFDR